MVNEEKFQIEPENDDVHRLLSGLKRVEAPKDFDFHVRARIAKGKPAERPVSWLPSVVRYGVPLGLALVVAGYFGVVTMNAPADSTIAAVPQVETSVSQPAPITPIEESQPSNETQAIALPDVASADTPEKLNPKPVVKTAPTTNPKTDKPGGGSYDTGAGAGANIRPIGDVDDNAPEPQGRRILISSREFLTNSGVSATYPSAGGRITSVGGAAASAGIIAGDVIESVNVQSGTIRVTRDGKSMTFRIR